MTDITTASTLPGYQPGTYAIDPLHSSVTFSIRHMMVAKVRGIIENVEGTVVLADQLADSTVEASVDPATINTRNADRDAHLRSGDFFATDEHPTWTFRSTAIEGSGADLTLRGVLGIRGVERDVTAELEFGGIGQDAYGNTRAGATASFRIDRTDYGITFNQALETGGVMLSNDVDVVIEISAVKQ